MYKITITDYADGTRLYRVVSGSVPQKERIPTYNCPFTDEPITKTFLGSGRDFSEDELRKRCKRSCKRASTNIREIALMNKWQYFLTLTFDPEKVDSFSYNAVVSALKNWIDTYRRLYSGIKYLLVPELHKSGRYHFHGLLSVPGCDLLNVCDECNLDNGYVVYHLKGYKLGFSTVSMIYDNTAASLYISKYITKSEKCVPYRKKSYWASRNLLTPKKDSVIIEPTDEDEFYNTMLFEQMLKDTYPCIHSSHPEGSYVWQSIYKEVLKNGIDDDGIR